MTRRTVLIEEMFKDVATPRELKKLEGIYARGNKGAATVFMIRIVKDYWDLHIAKKEPTSVTSTPLSDASGQERIIQFRSGNRIWLEKS